MLSQADHPALVATGAPFLLGLSYVGSLYVSSLTSTERLNNH